MKKVNTSYLAQDMALSSITFLVIFWLQQEGDLNADVAPAVQGLRMRFGEGMRAGIGVPALSRCMALLEHSS